MRLLVVEDDPDLNRQLTTALTDAGYVVDRAFDGEEGHFLGDTEPYDAVILDIGLPKMDGISVLESWRRTGRIMPVLLLTARDRWSDKVQGFDAGADDYVAKPFDRAELRARVNVGVRIVELQRSLSQNVKELVDALSQVKQLQGILPICSHCKKVRNDQDYWQQVEGYISAHSEVRFSHSVCPECYETIVLPQIDRLARQKSESEIAEP